MTDLPDPADLVLGSAPGPRLHLLRLGACIHRLEVTGGDGVRRDVVLGRDTAQQRLEHGGYHGAVVGRFANRIAHGDLPLPTGRVALPVNDRGHHLHGGPDGFHRRVWTVEESDATTARLSLVSPDGDQGYPGELRVVATYTVSADAVTLELSATTDAPTVVNLSQHAFFNLAGPGTGALDDHRLEVRASRYLPVDDEGIPLGGAADVTATPFDLRRPRRLGDVARDPHPQVVAAGGLDHTMVIDDDRPDDPAVVLTHPPSRTRMELTTDRPGVQVYTGNKLDGTTPGLGGVLIRQGDGVALEPQLFPDSPHHPEWPSATLAPGDVARTRTSWRFTAG